MKTKTRKCIQATLTGGVEWKIQSTGFVKKSYEG